MPRAHLDRIHVAQIQVVFTCIPCRRLSGVFRGALCEAPPLWPDRRDFFKDELSRLRTAKVSQVTRSVLFSLKCTRNAPPDPLGELKRSPDPLAVLGVGGPGREGKGWKVREGKEGRGGEGSNPLCEILPSTCILYQRQICRHGYMYPFVSASRTLLSNQLQLTLFMLNYDDLNNLVSK